MNKPADAAVKSKYVVVFPHRTTRDFLSTKGMQLVISSYVGQNFNPRTWLSTAFLYHLKQLSLNREEVIDVNKEIIFYCKLAEVYDKIVQIDLHDQAEQSFMTRAGFQGRNAASSLFMQFVVERGLILYTAHKVKASPDIVHARNGLLNDALPLWRLEVQIDTSMVQLLLEHNASPNQRKGETTVWGSLIKSLYEGRLRHAEAQSLLQAFDLLLRYGANPKY